MKLQELYSLTSGQIIDKIDIIEKFYPLNIEKYILFQPFSKPSKSYGLWQDVLDILYPILKENGYSVAQVGLSSEPLLPNCIDLRGKTTINQCAYLVHNAELVLTADSFCSHLAGHYNKNLVVLISNNYSECVRPYFGDKNKQIILEPDRTKRKPSFLLEEGPNKQINKIKVESIASSVCRLLNLPFNYEYETLFVGESYQNKILEATPHGVTNISNLGTDQMIERMDYEFNETILQQQMMHCPCVIVTDKPINLKILKAYKQRIKQIFYIITENNDPKFAMAITRLGIPLHMFSYLSEEKLNPFKLSYLDISPVFYKATKTKTQIKEIEGVPVDQLYYKSSKHILSSGKIYPSKAAYLENLPNPTINQITPIIDNDIWASELEYFIVLKRK